MVCVAGAVSAAVKLNVHDLPAKTMCVNLKVIHDMQETNQQKGNYLSGFQSTMAFPLVALAPFASAVRRSACESHLSLHLWRVSAGGQKRLEAQKEDSQSATSVAALRRLCHSCAFFNCATCLAPAAQCLSALEGHAQQHDVVVQLCLRHILHSGRSCRPHGACRCGRRWGWRGCRCCRCWCDWRGWRGCCCGCCGCALCLRLLEDGEHRLMLLQPSDGLQSLLLREDSDWRGRPGGPQRVVQLRPRHGGGLLHQGHMLALLWGLLLLQMWVLLLPLLPLLWVVLLQLLGHLLLLGRWRVLLLGHLLGPSCMCAFRESPAIPQRNELLVRDEVVRLCLAPCWDRCRCCGSGGGCWGCCSCCCRRCILSPLRPRRCASLSSPVARLLVGLAADALLVRAVAVPCARPVLALVRGAASRARPWVPCRALVCIRLLRGAPIAGPVTVAHALASSWPRTPPGIRPRHAPGLGSPWVGKPWGLLALALALVARCGLGGEVGLETVRGPLRELHVGVPALLAAALLTGAAAGRCCSRHHAWNASSADSAAARLAILPASASWRCCSSAFSCLLPALEVLELGALEAEVLVGAWLDLGWGGCLTRHGPDRHFLRSALLCPPRLRVEHWGASECPCEFGRCCRACCCSRTHEHVVEVHLLWGCCHCCIRLRCLRCRWCGRKATRPTS